MAKRRVMSSAAVVAAVVILYLYLAVIRTAEDERGSWVHQAGRMIGVSHTEEVTTGGRWLPSKFQELPSLFSDSSLNTTRYKIYQMETSKVTSLRPRFLCSIGSYCHHNPEAIVWLLLLEWKERENSTWEEVTMLQRSYPNLRLARFNMDDLLKDTPMAAIAEDPVVYESKYLANKLSNIARLAVVWKYGGFYSDLDVLCLHDVTLLNNILVMENNETINQSTFNFEAKHPLLRILMDSMNLNYKSNVWGATGPRMVTQAYRTHCGGINPIRVSPSSGRQGQAPPSPSSTGSSSSLHRWSNRTSRARLSAKDPASHVMLESNDTLACSSVVLLHHQTLAPITYHNINELFQINADVNVMEIQMESFGLHFYNKVSTTMALTAGSGVVMDVMAFHSCPLVYTTVYLRGGAL